MKTLEFASSWLDSRGIEYEYDSETDIVRFRKSGISFSIYTVPEHELFCITHSEALGDRDCQTRDLHLIAGIMQECVLTRPVRRLDLGRIKFKIVAYQKPENTEKWLDYSLKDMEKAIMLYHLVD